MKAQEINFFPFLNGKKHLFIPIYQRTYSWQREQCEQLWNDIIRAGTDQEMPGILLVPLFTTAGNYIVGNVPQFLLIDGSSV